MRKKKNKVLVLFFTVFAPVFLGFLISYHIFAQEEVHDLSGFVLTPAIIDRDVVPGEVLSLSVQVHNSERPGVTVYPLAADFVPDPGESGRPQFLKEGETTPEGISSWISFAFDKVFVDEGKREEFPFTLTVPQDVEPGTHYGAVILSRQAPSIGAGGAQIGITYDVATLVIIKVPGEVIEEGSFISLETTRKWYEYPPVTFLVRFENTGNVHLQPTGILEIFNMAGIKEGGMQVNKAFGRALPKSIRKYEVDWDPGKWFGFIPRMGRYTATALMVHGNPSVSTSLGPVSFWLIPWKFLLAVVGILALGILAFTAFMRLYGKSVISRHERGKDRK